MTIINREKKLLALIQKQDRLLYLCFYMLLNLSEDVGVEKKMKKKVCAHMRLLWALQLKILVSDPSNASGSSAEVLRVGIVAQSYG